MPRGGARPGAGRPPKPGLADDLSRFNKAKADKEESLARIRQAEAEQAEGNLIPLGVLRDVLASVSAQIAATLDAVPSKLKREAPHLTSEDLRLVEREITRARNLAAEIRYKPSPPSCR